MDLDDFWQENKRWLLGCIAGLLVFLIAYSILADGPRKGAPTSTIKDVYRSTQLAAVKKDSAALDQRLDTLRGAMEYQVPAAFKREGDPGLFWADTYIRVRKDLINLAEAENVDFPEEAFAWQPDTDPASIDRALIGCSLVDFMVRQLVDAHKQVVAADFDAIGLRALVKFDADRAVRGRRVRRRPDDPLRAEELLAEVKVRFKFQSDHATLHRFLENCRKASQRITLAGLKVVRGKRSGDPLAVSGEIVALTIKPIPKDM